MGRLVTLKKNQVHNMECKKQGAKKRVIGIQKEKRAGLFSIFCTFFKATNPRNISDRLNNLEYCVQIDLASVVVCCMLHLTPDTSPSWTA